jgi:hypothetical protein
MYVRGVGEVPSESVFDNSEAAEKSFRIFAVVYTLLAHTPENGWVERERKEVRDTPGLPISRPLESRFFVHMRQDSSLA